MAKVVYAVKNCSVAKSQFEEPVESEQYLHIYPTVVEDNRGTLHTGTVWHRPVRLHLQHAAIAAFTRVRVVCYCRPLPFHFNALKGDVRREDLVSESTMASVTTKLSFMILMAVMVLIGGLVTLLRILWAIITRPLTVFKKVPRNGELYNVFNITINMWSRLVKMIQA